VAAHDEPLRDVLAPATGVDVEEVYAAQARTLILQIYAYTGDMAAAQDIVQEAFCRALPRWDRIRRYDEPVAWLHRVAWNLATSRWRRIRAGALAMARLQQTHVPGPSPDRVALTEALARIPEAHRRALVLHYLADLSTAQIAAQEAVAESTVSVWLHRGRAALAGLLRDHGTEDAHA